MPTLPGCAYKILGLQSLLGIDVYSTQVRFLIHTGLTVLVVNGPSPQLAVGTHLTYDKAKVLVVNSVIPEPSLPLRKFSLE